MGGELAIMGQGGLDDSKVALLKKTIATGLTDAEFELFVLRARQAGLDPFAGQIHAVKRYDRATNSQKMTIQVGIHGLRLIAERTERYAPGRKTEYAYRHDGALESATAYVRKLVAGCWHECAETAHWTEYAQMSKEGALIGLWRSHPHVMLAKVAEALCLRRAFPQELSGYYAKEEMGTPEGEVVEASFHADDTPPAASASAESPPQLAAPPQDASDPLQAWQALLSAWEAAGLKAAAGDQPPSTKHVAKLAALFGVDATDSAGVAEGLRKMGVLLSQTAYADWGGLERLCSERLGLEGVKTIMHIKSADFPRLEQYLLHGTIADQHAVPA